jgi:hypothetical protein
MPPEIRQRPREGNTGFKAARQAEIYEDAAEVNWFSVSPEQTKQIADTLKWVGLQLK